MGSQQTPIDNWIANSNAYIQIKKPAPLGSLILIISDSIGSAFLGKKYAE
jgi:hypothetical protein